MTSGLKVMRVRLCISASCTSNRYLLYTSKAFLGETYQKYSLDSDNICDIIYDNSARICDLLFIFLKREHRAGRNGR